MRVRFVRDGFSIPAIWVAIALSLLIHAAALWNWFPELRLHLKAQAERGETRIALQARLIPPASVASPSVPQLPPMAKPLPQQRFVAPPSSPPSPPVIVLSAPLPSLPLPQASPPMQGDLASFIEARRRARGEPTAVPGAPSETEEARRNRIVASNLASQNASSLAFDPDPGGGVFQMQRLGVDRAEFVFYGWNKDIRRKASQVIDVRRGNQGDIRLAVVRRMIAIIREHEKEDFTWESQQLGRVITLSARQRDNEGLEAFMLREFFPR